MRACHVADPAERAEPRSAGERASHIVIVPARPGPIRELRGLSDAGTGDELDEVIEELFGETTDERPGVFDLLLLGVGIGFIAWSVAMNVSGPLFPLGVLLLVLGLALPARSVVRAAHRRRLELAKRRATRTGYALDIGDPATARLAAAYARLLGASTPVRDRTMTQAIEGGHLALVEVATLLDGRAPEAPEQIDYVERRTRAIRNVVAEFERSRRSRIAAAAVGEEGEAARLRRAAALARARDELADSFGSEDQLELARELLRRERTDG